MEIKNQPHSCLADVEYFLKVVDCQYACPAHTPVPEYIRLIAQGLYTESYLLNRSSNVFPGILGRVCDRPCEPACRRSRIAEKEPVAICRLKRVAADFKDDIKNHLPIIPKEKNGKKIALIGAGPASLTVANDLMPLGYQIDLYEKQSQPGGAMRAQVPGFRLPEKVLDEEIGYILDFGVRVFYNYEVCSLKSFLEYDAVFVGTGAPVPKDLSLPGRGEAAKHIHLGLHFLANVRFSHLSSIGSTVIVIGGGNTAMDCCRSALRLGAKTVIVIAPESYEQMLASSWEKEDAEHEGVVIKNLLLPKAFACDEGQLKGVYFQPLAEAYNDKGIFDPKPSDRDQVLINCDDVILAIGQKTAYDFIEKDLGLFDQDEKLILDEKTFCSAHPKIFFAGDAAFGPKNIIWAVAQAHEAALSIHLRCTGRDLKDRPLKMMELRSQKMTLNQWSYDNDFSSLHRNQMPLEPMEKRFSALDLEVEKGFDVKLAIKEAHRCLNCDVQTVFESSTCIECDACIDICPVNCLSFEDKDVLISRLSKEEKSLIYFSPVLQTNRFMVKSEDICLHCGLCAERCPTSAWDMQKFSLLKESSPS